MRASNIYACITILITLWLCMIFQHLRNNMGGKNNQIGAKKNVTARIHTMDQTSRIRRSKILKPWNLEFNENVYVVVQLNDKLMTEQLTYIFQYIFKIKKNNTYIIDYSKKLSNAQYFRTISSLAMDGVLPRIDVILMNDYSRIRYFIRHASEEPFFKPSSIIQIYNSNEEGRKVNALKDHQKLQWSDYSNKTYDAEDYGSRIDKLFLKKIKESD